MVNSGEVSGVTGGWRAVEPVETCRRLLHRSPFVVRHRLDTNPLFDLKTLVATARAARLRREDAFFHEGEVEVGDHWGDLGPQDRPVEEIVAGLSGSRSWIILKHVEREEQYARVLGEFARFVSDLAGPSGAAELHNPEMLVIMSSPGRITPFHFDSEVNFLVQVHGTKEVWICDPDDRSIITEDELELYYMGDLSSGKFKPDAEAKARYFKLQPGDAVHIPSHSAHWIRNGDAVSVSLSLNLEFPPQKYQTKYRARRYLRKVGVRPGSMPWLETGLPASTVVGAAQFATRSLSAARSMVKAVSPGARAGRPSAVDR